MAAARGSHDRTRRAVRNGIREIRDPWTSSVGQVISVVIPARVKRLVGAVSLDFAEV